MRKLAESADSVIVVAGAIFAEFPERIGAGRVAVPSELYNVAVISQDGRTRMMAAVMPNTETAGSLGSFIVTAAEVEKRTGLKFFPEFDANR